MIQTFQKGVGLNTVYGIADRFVYKRYIDKEKAKREVFGLTSWNKYCGNIAPKVYFQFNGKTVVQMIHKEYKYKKNSKKLILKELASYYAEFSKTFKYHKELSDKAYTNWNQYITNLYNNFLDDKEYISTFLTSNEILEVCPMLEDIVKIDWSCFEKFPLHRDLHWGNILKDESGIKIIDFEHTCLGPIEFEFSNSLFWNDKHSLNFDTFCTFLAKEGITVNRQLAYKFIYAYFAEQIHIAKMNIDLDKTVLLVKVMRLFLDSTRTKPSYNKHPLLYSCQYI